MYLKAPLCLLLGFLAFKISQKFQLKPWKNKTVVIFSIAALVILCHPSNFFSQLSFGFHETKAEIDALNEYIEKSSWGQSSLKQQEDKDFILIIGESARRDYFQIYGYPIKDTPYLASTPATIVDGLLAGGTYTVGSLRLMLTQADTKNWTPRYDRNIIDLANSAGIETIWLSNQGFIGKHDTPISAIGFKASIFQFPTKRSYDKNLLSDYHLIPKFRDLISQSHKGPRFFVLHTIGSHPDACQRILDMRDSYHTSDRRFDYLACYVSSIRKTDNFIKQIVATLKLQQEISHRPFSIIYFSDHGLAHRELDDHRIVINNNLVSYFHYDIPLIKIDSNQGSQHYLKSKKSGLRFTDGLATWLGISNEKLKPYDLFDGISDLQDYGFNNHRENQKTVMDPAINIQRYLTKTK